MPTRIATMPAGSAVYCSVHDLALFGMFHLKNHLHSQEKIFSDAAIDEMQAPSLGPKEQQQYGLSWWIQNDLHGFHGVLAQGGTIDSTAYLQLIPSEDLAVAFLSNTGLGDGNKIVDAVLAAVLPRYRENLDREAASTPSPQQAVPVLPGTGMVGAWKGFVQTYKGKVPLTIRIDGTGAVIAKLGLQPEVRIQQANFAENTISWRMPGSLGVEGEPFELLFTLELERQLLTGGAETRPFPANVSGFRTYYWVQLSLR